MTTGELREITATAAQIDEAVRILCERYAMTLSKSSDDEFLCTTRVGLAAVLRIHGQLFLDDSDEIETAAMVETVSTSAMIATSPMLSKRSADCISED